MMQVLLSTDNKVSNRMICLLKWPQLQEPSRQRLPELLFGHAQLSDLPDCRLLVRLCGVLSSSTYCRGGILRRAL